MGHVSSAMATGGAIQLVCVVVCVCTAKGGEPEDAPLLGEQEAEFQEAAVTLPSSSSG